MDPPTHGFNREFPGDLIRESSGEVWPVIHELASKPCPYLVKAFDTHDGTDYNADYAWHVFDKEKRWKLPWRHMLGVINPNSDIGRVLGFGLENGPGRYDRPFRPIAHLIDIIIYDVDLGPGLRCEVMFRCHDSHTLAATVHVENLTCEDVHLTVWDCLIRRRNGSPPEQRWTLKGQLFGSGVTTTTGNLCSRKPENASDCEDVIFHEWIGGNSEPARLMVAQEGGPAKWILDKDWTPGKSGSFPPGCFQAHYLALEVPPGKTIVQTTALCLCRYTETALANPDRTPLLYPEMSRESASIAAHKSCSAATHADWKQCLRDSVEAYYPFPVIQLPEDCWNRDFYACLELPRASTFSSYNHIRTPFYNFCRVHAHDPYGWWSYGMHAHENLATMFNNIVNPELSADFLRGHFQFQQPDGLYPYGVSHLSEPIHKGQATAPLIVWEAWNCYLWSGDRKFMREAYESGRRNHEWWLKTRDRNGMGLCHWLNASNESVRDDDALATWQATEGCQNQAALDLNCYLLVQERSLAAMAAELGIEGESEFHEKQARRRAAIMNTSMWHEGDRCYYGIREDQPGWARVKDISTFFPLWSQLATNGRFETIAALLDDPETFGLPHGPPVLAKNEPGWGPQKHWQGANWVEMSLFPILGLKAYGYYNKAAELAYRNTKMVFDELEKYGHFREYFNSMTGQGADLIDYIWTAMPAWFIIHVFFGIEPLAEGVRVLPALPREWPGISLRGLRIRNRRMDLSVKREIGAESVNARYDGVRLDTLKERGVLIPWDRLRDGASLEILQPWDIADRPSAPEE